MTQFIIHNMAPLMFIGLFAFLLLGYPVAFAFSGAARAHLGGDVE